MYNHSSAHLVFFATAALATAAPALPVAVTTPESDIDALVVDFQTVSTLLTEVRRSTVDGRDYLTLDLDHVPVGPPECRSATVGVATERLGEPARSNRIETMALSAMLRTAPVEITVSLDAELCSDGKPAFTDLQPLRRSP